MSETQWELLTIVTGLFLSTSSTKVHEKLCAFAHLKENEAQKTLFLDRSDIVDKNVPTRLRTEASPRGDYSKRQMERVKLHKNMNWASAKSQSSTTNRFKVLN